MKFGILERYTTANHRQRIIIKNICTQKIKGHFTSYWKRICDSTRTKVSALPPTLIF